MKADQRMRARVLLPHIRNGYTWLNHAAISPIPLPVRTAMETCLKQRSEGPVESFSQWEETSQSCRERVRDLIHAESAGRIAFTANTSEGLSLVAEGLPWNDGDEILLNDM